MSEEIRDRDVVLAMDAQEPIIAEMDNDVALEIDAPNDIEITLEQPEVIVQELSGDNAIGMIAGSLSTFAKEKTLTDGISSIEGKLDNLNVDVDLSPVAKEETLVAESKSIKDKIDSIVFPTTDLSSVAKETTLNSAKVEIITAIDNATPEIDLTEVAKETTLNSAKEEILTAVENAKPEVDLSGVAKQGENPEATNSKILEEVGKIPNIARLYTAYAVKNDDGENTYSIVLPVSADIINETTIKLQ